MDAIGSVTGRLYHAGPLLARAGEGAVYRVRGDGTILLKIFDVPPPLRLVEKLIRLSQFSPKPANTALPLETLVDVVNREVIGYVQPFIARAIPLTRALDTASRRLVGLSNSIQCRVKICRLLSEAFARLHGSNLVMGDVSDSNFLISSDWRRRPTVISVIDCNSLQVTVRTNGGNEIFPSGVATEAFTAPEVQSTDWSISPRTIFSDSFGLAVACWLVIFNGSHPFAVATPRNVDVPPLGERIQNRLFPYAPASPLPAGWSMLTLDPSLGILTDELREMFFRTFSTMDPRDRPTADEWVQAFRSWEAKPMPRVPLRKLLSWNTPFPSDLMGFIEGWRSYAGQALVLIGILLLAFFFSRFQPTLHPVPNSETIRDRSIPSPSRPRYVDPDLFPEPIWKSNP